MGDCKYCGKPVGLLGIWHSECHREHAEGVEAISQAISTATARTSDVSRIMDEVELIARQSHVRWAEAREIVARGWAAAVDNAVQDGVLTTTEEQRIDELARALRMDVGELPQAQVQSLSMARTLREVIEGRIPPCGGAVGGALPFNYQRGEQPVWVFPDVQQIVEKTTRDWVAGSSGVSFRVARGIYYRVGGSRGHAIESTSMVVDDTGPFAVTTKHVYFGGARRAARIPYTKIVAFQPFSDGVGITRDGVSAKPVNYVTGSGWFVYNLLMNLSRSTA